MTAQNQDPSEADFNRARIYIRYAQIWHRLIWARKLLLVLGIPAAVALLYYAVLAIQEAKLQTAAESLKKEAATLRALALDAILTPARLGRPLADDRKLYAAVQIATEFAKNTNLGANNGLENDVLYAIGKIDQAVRGGLLDDVALYIPPKSNRDAHRNHPLIQAISSGRNGPTLSFDPGKKAHCERFDFAADKSVTVSANYGKNTISLTIKPSTKLWKPQMKGDSIDGLPIPPASGDGIGAGVYGCLSLDGQWFLQWRISNDELVGTPSIVPIFWIKEDDKGDKWRFESRGVRVMSNQAFLATWGNFSKKSPWKVVGLKVSSFNRDGFVGFTVFSDHDSSSTVATFWTTTGLSDVPERSDLKTPNDSRGCRPSDISFDKPGANKATCQDKPGETVDVGGPGYQRPYRLVYRLIDPDRQMATVPPENSTANALESLPPFSCVDSSSRCAVEVTLRVPDPLKPDEIAYRTRIIHTLNEVSWAGVISDSHNHQYLYLIDRRKQTWRYIIGAEHISDILTARWLGLDLKDIYELLPGELNLGTSCINLGPKCLDLDWKADEKGAPK